MQSVQFSYLLNTIKNKFYYKVLAMGSYWKAFECDLCQTYSLCLSLCVWVSEWVSDAHAMYMMRFNVQRLNDKWQFCINITAVPLKIQKLSENLRRTVTNRSFNMEKTTLNECDIRTHFIRRTLSRFLSLSPHFSVRVFLCIEIFIRVLCCCLILMNRWQYPYGM